MRLVVSVPDGAQGVRVDVDPLVPLPADRGRWCAEVLRRELPAGGSVEEAAIGHGKSDAGWPMTIVTTRVRDADGQTTEVRLTAFYDLLHHGGVVTCRFVSRTASERGEQAIRDMLARAAPDFDDGAPTSIADLYDP